MGIIFLRPPIHDLFSTFNLPSCHPFFLHVMTPQETLHSAIRRHARYSLGANWDDLSGYEAFMTVALAVRDQVIDRQMETEQRFKEQDAKRLYYLSMEFLMGRALANNLINLGLYEVCREVTEGYGSALEDILDQERDAALGNGGLGRLAACFLDSLATLDMPGYGYGINYQYGLFRQEIIRGYQSEKPDNWMADGNPWLIDRSSEACIVPVYGRIEHGVDRAGIYKPMWLDWHMIIGVPSDFPIVGYGGRTVNMLRLYAAHSSQEFDIDIFNAGDYLRAVEEKISTERISKILYPSDEIMAGQELRLVQEYFFVACALRDIMARFDRVHSDMNAFPDKAAIHLNDTHPTLAIVELMRLLIDERGLDWGPAWRITQATMGYTNHTLLPEALERWPVPLFERVLPRHLQVIYEINRRFLEQIVVRWPGDIDRMNRMSIVEESEPKQIRMGNLAIVGSHSVNGVAELHSKLVTTTLAPDFYELWPERFNNKTNGVTPRRWLLQANPQLAELITQRIGERWITDLDVLRDLEDHADDPIFQASFTSIKQTNKKNLADLIKHKLHVDVDVNSLFDVQVKRIHEYKRQLLNVMHIIHQYLTLVEDGQVPTPPRTYILGGKAAPGYWAAKQMIKLINNVAQVVNNDPLAQGHLKVVFLPDYRVSLAERIMPAANLSEQISTAGKEASGTGNMKFALNGALTIGTLDGANIEIMEEVGEENIYIFGLTADEIQTMQKTNAYDPRALYDRCPEIKRVLDALDGNRFCAGEPGLFRWIVRTILEDGDPYFHLADLPEYIKIQQRVGVDYMKTSAWTRKAILNVARIGKFSSDRTIREYARDIWGIKGY
jgi:glycogen phosphorylase